EQAKRDLGDRIYTLQHTFIKIEQALDKAEQNAVKMNALIADMAPGAVIVEEHMDAMQKAMKYLAKHLQSALKKVRSEFDESSDEPAASF
ncbi:MAG: hypothetical protein GY868_05185, partial [Deltaproteobacteria bacterium]|nr:hypothetical protein [Deltaproteobacteria bacterium]